MDVVLESGIERTSLLWPCVASHLSCHKMQVPYSTSARRNICEVLEHYIK